MDKLFISSIVGLSTYLILNLNNENKENESTEQNGGDKLGCSNNFPDCFQIDNFAQEVFKELRKEKKCELPEFNKLGQLYSEVFCLEIALGNNEAKKVEKDKVNNRLIELNKIYKQSSNEDNIKKFLENTFNQTEKLLKTLTKTSSIIKKNNMIKEIHESTIIDLFKKNF
jgi:hypothetical protein